MGDHLMAKELYEAAEKGNEGVFDKKKGYDDKYLVKKTSEGNNILHISIQFGNLDFAKTAFSKYQRLMWEENRHSNTPLHFAAELRDGPHMHLDLLETIVKDACQQLKDPEHLRKKNFAGNTALHVAIIHGRLEIAHLLLGHDPSLAKIVNEASETPLHLVFKHFPHVLQNPDDDMHKKQQQNFVYLMKRKVEKLDRQVVGVTAVEKMGVMISMLLAISSEMASRQDNNGLTPLHLAAGLSPFYNLPVIQHIIECYPQSREVCDARRRTILHHLINRIQYVPQGKNLLSETRIKSLINHQDNDGNTPFHLSILQNDIVMVKLLYYIFEADTLVKNNHGESPMSLLEQDNFKVLHAEKMMTDEICRRAEYGDVFALKEHLVTFGPQFFDSLDSNGRNVIHKLFLMKSGNIIIPEEFLRFINRDQVPPSLRKSDNNGDTPIHILARLNPDSIMIHLATGFRPDPTYTEDLYLGPKPNDPKCFISSYQKYTYVWEKLGTTSFFQNIINYCTSVLEPNTLPQNDKGNTALHEAILARNYQFFVELAMFHKGATALANHRNETLLHLLAPLNPTPPIIHDDVINHIIEDNTRDECQFCNKDGLSPLIIAIQSGNIEFAKRLVSKCPKLAEVKSPKGQTFWHLLVNVTPAAIKSFDFEKSSFKANEAVLKLLNIKDNDEKTALHIAIEHRRFDVAKILLQLHETSPFNSSVLHIPNKEGDTPGNMIGSLPYLPREFESFIWKDSMMIGTRSIWGIPTTQIKEYVNTMGVIAALLTTITFTAAFTVPGGLNQEKGIPLLINEPAFKVFIISDVLAMCFSMMVLFCLLWIMATGDKTKSVVLLDFSIILLLASFYTTLLTFMTGLYATLHLVKHVKGIAIFTLVFCSVLLLLMQKCLVIKWVIPSGKLILIFFEWASRSAKEAFKKCMPCFSSSMPAQPNLGDHTAQPSLGHHAC